MALGRGGHDKHARSTAADQPALLPEYKITWFWGGGMISTPAELLHPSKFIFFWGWGVVWGGGGGGGDKHTRSTEPAQPAL